MTSAWHGVQPHVTWLNCVCAETGMAPSVWCLQREGALCLHHSSLLSLKASAKPLLLYITKVDGNAFFSSYYFLHQILLESDEICVPKSWMLWWVSTHCHSLTSCPLSGHPGRLRTAGRPKFYHLSGTHTVAANVFLQVSELLAYLHQRCSPSAMTEQWTWSQGCQPCGGTRYLTLHLRSLLWSDGLIFTLGQRERAPHIFQAIVAELRDRNAIYKCLIREPGPYAQIGAAQPLPWGHFLGR